MIELKIISVEQSHESEGEESVANGWITGSVSTGLYSGYSLSAHSAKIATAIHHIEKISFTHTHAFILYTGYYI